MNPRLLRPTAGAAPCPYPASLLLHFDGNFTDSSPNALTVTANGDAATSTAQSKFGGYSFSSDGSADSGLIVTSDGTSASSALTLSADFTIEFFIRFNSLDATQALVQTKWTGSENAVAIWHHAGWPNTISAWVKTHSGEEPLLVSSSITTGQWYHVAFQRSGNVFSLFIDGVESATATASLTISEPVAAIGCYVESVPVGTFYLPADAFMDELRITNGLAVYDCAFIPPTAPLSACVTPVPTSREASLLLHFDGNFTDSSPNGLTVTANGDAATSTAQSRFGGASLLLDGTGDSCLSASSSAFAFDGPFTIEAWIYAVSWPSYCWLCDFRNSGDFTFGFGSGAFYPYFGGTDHGAAGTALPTGQWVHIAFVYDGNQCRMYADGVLYRTVNESGMTQAACSVAIGSRYTQGTEFFDGYIDDLRIVKGLAVYKGPFTPPTAPLPAIATPQPVNASLVLNFDGNFTDESVNGLTVTPAVGAAISTGVKKFGSGSLTGGHCTTPYSGLFSMNGDFTLEAWIYPLSNGETVDNGAFYPYVANAFNMVYSQSGAADGYGAILFTYDGSISFLRADESGGSWSTVMLSLGAVATNQWSHVAVVRKADTTRVYLNGTVAGSATTDHNTVAATNVNIGHYPFTNGYEPVGFDGYIDGVRFTKAALYCNEFTPPTAPPTPTAVPSCCPPCPAYGTYIRSECQGPDYGDVYADGNCNEYFEVTSFGGCE